MTLLMKLKALVRFLRIKDWFHFLPIVLISYQFPPSDIFHVIISLLLAGFCLAFAYGYNLFEDDGIALADPLETLANYGLSARWLLAVLGLVAVMGLGLAFSFGMLAFLATLVMLLSSYVYSGGPTLKRFPVVGSFSNLMIFIPIAFMGTNSNLDINFVLLLLAFAGFVMQAQIIHEVADTQEDIEQGIQTTAINYGSEFSRRLSIVFGLVTILAFLLMSYVNKLWDILFIAVGLILFSIVYIVLVDFDDVESVRKLRLSLRYVGLLSGGLAWCLIGGCG